MKKIKINYINQFSELEIQRLINFCEMKIIDLIYDRFDFHYVRKPLFSVDKIVDEISEINYSRTITFDTINDYQIYNIYNSFDFWFVKKITKLNLENNHGIFTKLNYIVRDLKIDSNNSLERNILFFEIRSDNITDVFQKMETLGRKIYQLIYDLFFEMHLFNPKVKINIPKINKLTFFNQITFKKQTQDYQSFINQIALKYGVVSVLEELNEKEDEDFLNSKDKITFYYFSKYLRENLKFIEIFKRKEKEEILQEVKKIISNKIELDYLSEQIEDFKYKTINIKINLDYLILMALDIASVFEIQANSNNRKVEEFIEKSKINTLF
ncbi:/ / hypothetical protein / 28407:29378 Forward [Candidatus Hepatoplasma crinochetorum]|uniref:Uncharacterized protein n=1 Tax=Candidatus Hepatoplasma crinochetorum TaxID=295596 RepID=A0A0G7ZNA4_9MOLU|nr:/ / hypothetical protein / 28407:29378 Forward [Candidatus Hepatoplasma crinochetorum]